MMLYFYWCSGCKRFKFYTRFHKNKSKSNGLSSYCKDCTKRYNHEYYFRNKAFVMDSHNKSISPLTKFLRMASLNSPIPKVEGMVRKGCPWCHAWLYLPQEKGEGFCHTCDLPYTVTKCLNDTVRNTGGISLHCDYIKFKELYPTRYAGRTFKNVKFPRPILVWIETQHKDNEKNEYNPPNIDFPKKCPKCGSKVIVNPNMPFGGCPICKHAFLIDVVNSKKHDLHYIHLTSL